MTCVESLTDTGFCGRYKQVENDGTNTIIAMIPQCGYERLVTQICNISMVVYRLTTNIVVLSADKNISGNVIIVNYTKHVCQRIS